MSPKSAAPPVQSERLLTQEQVGEILQIATRQVGRVRPRIPQVRVGHKLRRYRLSDLLAWIDQRASRQNGRRS